MTVFNSVGACISALKGDIKAIVLGELKTIAEQVVRENVNKLVYGAKEPFIYNRTHELLESVTVEPTAISGNGVGFKVFMDTGKITANIVDDGDYWNQHASMRGEDVSEMIPVFMEEGHGGLYNQQGTHYMQTSYEELMTRLARELASALRARGWEVIGF